MNTFAKKSASLAAALAMMLAVAACEKEGPAERAGKSVDNAVENTGEKIEPAGEKVQDAADGRDKK